MVVGLQLATSRPWQVIPVMDTLSRPSVGWRGAEKERWHLSRKEDASFGGFGCGYRNLQQIQVFLAQAGGLANGVGVKAHLFHAPRNFQLLLALALGTTFSTTFSTTLSTTFSTTLGTTFSTTFSTTLSTTLSTTFSTTLSTTLG